MLDELESFVTTHHDKTFNIFFLGDLNETEGVRIKLEKKNRISNDKCFRIYSQ